MGSQYSIVANENEKQKSASATQREKYIEEWTFIKELLVVILRDLSPSAQIAGGKVIDFAQPTEMMVCATIH
jgi:hypothetical protein